MRQNARRLPLHGKPVFVQRNPKESFAGERGAVEFFRRASRLQPDRQRRNDKSAAEAGYLVVERDVAPVFPNGDRTHAARRGTGVGDAALRFHIVGMPGNQIRIHPNGCIRLQGKPVIHLPLIGCLNGDRAAGDRKRSVSERDFVIIGHIPDAPGEIPFVHAEILHRANALPRIRPRTRIVEIVVMPFDQGGVAIGSDYNIRRFERKPVVHFFRIGCRYRDRARMNGKRAVFIRYIVVERDLFLILRYDPHRQPVFVFPRVDDRILFRHGFMPRNELVSARRRKDESRFAVFCAVIHPRIVRRPEYDGAWKHFKDARFLRYGIVCRYITPVRIIYDDPGNPVFRRSGVRAVALRIRRAGMPGDERGVVF